MYIGKVQGNSPLATKIRYTRIEKAKHRIINQSITPTVPRHNTSYSQ